MGEPNFLFDGWAPILRILLVGSATYLTLMLLVRISGQRTLAQMSVFDFILAVAIGASFGRILTAREVSIAEGVTAAALLVTLQYVLSSLQYRFSGFARIVRATPVLVFFQGDLVEGTLRKNRLRIQDLHTALRKQGIGSFADVEAIVLEADGKLTVIQTESAHDGSSFRELVE